LNGKKVPKNLVLPLAGLTMIFHVNSLRVMQWAIDVARPDQNAANKCKHTICVPLAP
jgi:hypothetical protein